jgi:hypothetical protein
MMIPKGEPQRNKVIVLMRPDKPNPLVSLTIGGDADGWEEARLEGPLKKCMQSVVTEMLWKASDVLETALRQVGGSGLPVTLAFRPRGNRQSGPASV